MIRPQASGSARVSIALGADTLVEFDCRDLVQEPDDEDRAPDGAAPSVEFEVTVGAADKKGPRLVFECLAEDEAGVQIDAVSYYPAGADDSDDSLYDGPKFDELDPQLQAAFYTYLESKGVDEELGKNINALATAKETLEYVTWLQRVEALVKA